MEVIASRKNPLVLMMRRAAAGDEPDRMVLDGQHLVEEARAARVPLAAVAFASRTLATPDGRIRRLATTLAGTGVRVVQVSDAVMAAMSPTTTPSGVIALAARPRHTLANVLAKSPALLVVAIDVQDPGNVGAMARVAEAAGATGLIAAGTSADPFGWKALRGSMGSALRLPIVREPSVQELLSALAAHGIKRVATAPGAPIPFDRYDWRQPTACLVGSEGLGLPPEVFAEADARVSIPMEPPVESLNVAVSTALLVYEARRARMRG
ncbi:MAG TPA: RNA methyltransferase [Vicinamibacterales bacterium]